MGFYSYVFVLNKSLVDKLYILKWKTVWYLKHNIRYKISNRMYVQTVLGKGIFIISPRINHTAICNHLFKNNNMRTTFIKWVVR